MPVQNNAHVRWERHAIRSKRSPRLIELMLVVLLLFGIAAYLAFHPELMSILDTIKTQINNTPNPDDLLTQISHTCLTRLLLRCVVVLFCRRTGGGRNREITDGLDSFDRLASPAQGFVIGD